MPTAPARSAHEQLTLAISQGRVAQVRKTLPAWIDQFSLQDQTYWDTWGQGAIFLATRFNHHPHQQAKIVEAILDTMAKRGDTLTPTGWKRTLLDCWAVGTWLYIPRFVQAGAKWKDLADQQGRFLSHAIQALERGTWTHLHLLSPKALATEKAMAAFGKGWAAKDSQLRDPLVARAITANKATAAARDALSYALAERLALSAQVARAWTAEPGALLALSMLREAQWWDMGKMVARLHNSPLRAEVSIAVKSLCDQLDSLGQRRALEGATPQAVQARGGYRL